MDHFYHFQPVFHCIFFYFFLRLYNQIFYDSFFHHLSNKLFLLNQLFQVLNLLKNQLNLMDHQRICLYSYCYYLMYYYYFQPLYFQSSLLIFLILPVRFQLVPLFQLLNYLTLFVYLLPLYLNHYFHFVIYLLLPELI